METIFLINPPQPKPNKTTIVYGPAAPPLGLCYLASKLKKDGFNVIAIDFEKKNTNISTLKEAINKHNPAVVGITCLTNTYVTALTIAKLIKSFSDTIKIVMGGQHPSFCFEEALKYDFVDFIAIGEAEKSFLDLCKAIINNSNFNHINGIAFRRDGKTLHSLPESIVDIDNIEFPDRFVFDINSYIDPISIISSRGCAARCIFCSASAFRDAKVRFRSAKNVLEEINLLYSNDFRVFNFMDDNFMLKKQRVVDICKGLKNNMPESLWTCSARADCVDKELIKLMSYSGCKGLHFGVETASSESQKSIGKYLSLEKLDSALKLAYKYNIRTFCSFILGLPGEDINQIKKNIEYALSLYKKYKTGIVFGLLTPFPGTRVFDNAKELGIKILSRDYSQYDIYHPVIETKYFTQNQLKEILYEAQKSYLQLTSKDKLKNVIELK
ncbi:MAG: radical SAM protein [Cyanobacteriota bacterium]